MNYSNLFQQMRKTFADLNCSISDFSICCGECIFQQSIRDTDRVLRKKVTRLAPHGWIYNNFSSVFALPNVVSNTIVGESEITIQRFQRFQQLLLPFKGQTTGQDALLRPI